MAKVLTDAAQAPFAEPQQTPEENSIIEVNNGTFRSIVKNLVSSGKAKPYSNLLIKNINVTPKDTYDRISITLNQKVPGYSPEGEPIMTNIIYTTGFSIAAIFKENEDISFLNGVFTDTPGCDDEDVVRKKEMQYRIFLNGATIEMLQRHYSAGETMERPFASDPNANLKITDHNVYCYDVINVKLGSRAEKAANAIMLASFGL